MPSHSSPAPIDDPHSTLANAGVTCLERGWLSANNILIRGEGPTALVDSGYSAHAPQTLALVAANLEGAPLDLLLNTHLHSDHCGGNAELQQAYPALRTLIPPGQAASVANWDPVALTFEPTGQSCPRFTHQGLLTPGTSIRLGSLNWHIHAAKGHDPHSIVLFQAEHRLLISADALWKTASALSFPSSKAFQRLMRWRPPWISWKHSPPTTVIPGHGRVFNDFSGALARARSRLEQFVTQPDKHRRHALKVLIKFKLLEWQSVSMDALLDWVLATSYFFNTMPQAVRHDRIQTREWLDQLLIELERSQSLFRNGDMVINR